MQTLDQFYDETQKNFYPLKLMSCYKNGNHFTALFHDGTKLKKTINEKDDHFIYEFPSNFDLHINNKCDAGCPYCHENSTPNGETPSLKDFVNSKFYDSVKSGTEMAIGGGNIFESPDIEVLLKANAKKGIVSNVTVNQRHVVKNLDTLKRWVEKKLVYGIGLSLVDSSDRTFWDAVDQLGENVVIHVIAGILSKNDYFFLRNRKVLILGYKNLRRGAAYFSDEVQKRINELKLDLINLSNRVAVLSADCLAIEQLDFKTVLNIKDIDWNFLYQGSDTDVKDADGNITCSTMYIDLCNGPTCARMSTAALDKRFKFSYDESIEDVFKKSIQGW